MCCPARKFLAGVRLRTLKIQIRKTARACPEANFRWPQKTNKTHEEEGKKKKKNSLANSPQRTKSRFMSPCRCGNHERSVLSSFVIQSLRFLPSLSSFSPLLFPGAVAVLEPVSLFCFDVYKPAKPQTPVQVQSSGTVRGAAREPLLSFACSLTLSPPASLSISLSLSSRQPRPPPTPPKSSTLPTSQPEDAVFYPRASALIGYPGRDWQIFFFFASLAPGARALLPAVPIG